MLATLPHRGFYNILNEIAGLWRLALKNETMTPSWYESRVHSQLGYRKAIKQQRLPSLDGSSSLSPISFYTKSSVKPSCNPASHKYFASSFGSYLQQCLTTGLHIISASLCTKKATNCLSTSPVCHKSVSNSCINKNHMRPCPRHPRVYLAFGSPCASCVAEREAAERRRRAEEEKAQKSKKTKKSK